MTSNSHRPDVSVIVPCYNDGEFIGQALDSVLLHTGCAVEIIVVDDGSTDPSAEIVQGYTDRRVKLIRQRNQGVAAARNVGLDAATGRFVKYLDADDMLGPGALDHQLEKLLASRNAALCTCKWARFFGSLDERQVVVAPDWTDLDTVDFLRLELGGGGTMPVMTWLASRETCMRIGPWPNGVSILEDTEYMTRLALAGDRVVFAGQAWGFYRSGQPGSLSRARSRRHHEQVLAQTRRICEIVENDPRASRMRPFLANFCRRATMRLLGVAPDLARESERMVASYGGSCLLPDGGGRKRRAVAAVLGWKASTALVNRYNAYRGC